MLTHFNVVSNILQSINSLPCFTAESTFIGVLPFTHIYALTLIALGAPALGAKTVVMSAFDPGTFLTNVQVHRVTAMHIVPPIVVFLSKHPVVAKFDLSSVKVDILFHQYLLKPVPSLVHGLIIC